MADRPRLLSLDAFRGLTIAAMIVVNSPGNDAAYAPLCHSRWDGCTPTDLVFPFFLFIVGTAAAFSLEKRRGRPLAENLPGLARRAALLFAWGCLLNAIPNWHPATFRFAGVLQRIGVCYLAAALLVLYARLETQVAAAAAILVGYWAALALVPVPGYGAGVLTPAGSLPSYVDRLLMGRHTYFQGPFDPEGFLSTLPALATTLLGVFAGEWLKSGRRPGVKTAGLAAAGALALLVGLAWSRAFPLNKALWTSSFVLYTGGWAALLLAAFYWAADARGWTAWARPLEVFGTNAIAAYVLHLLVLKALVYTRVAWGGHPVSPRILLCDALFGSWLSPLNASLGFALAYSLFWLGVLGVLYRRRIFIRI